MRRQTTYPHPASLRSIERSTVQDLTAQVAQLKLQVQQLGTTCDALRAEVVEQQAEIEQLTQRPESGFAAAWLAPDEDVEGDSRQFFEASAVDERARRWLLARS